MPDTCSRIWFGIRTKDSFYIYSIYSRTEEYILRKIREISIAKLIAAADLRRKIEFAARVCASKLGYWDIRVASTKFRPAIMPIYMVCEDIICKMVKRCVFLRYLKSL